MKNLNSIDSRWVVETTTVKIWEISGGEEMFLGMVKDGWQRYSGILPPGFL